MGGVMSAGRTDTNVTWSTIRADKKQKMNKVYQKISGLNMASKQGDFIVAVNFKD